MTIINKFLVNKNQSLILLCLGILFALSPLLIPLFVVWNYGRFIYTIPDTPTTQVGIVLDSEVLENGRLSDVLRDRMDVAIDLYHAGKVDVLLLSGIIVLKNMMNQVG